MSLVVDMCRPLQGSGRTVNVENYYTSPEIAVRLREMDIFMRGTVRKDRYGFPPGVCFTKMEATKTGRGAIKTMVDVENGLVAHGWCDGNPVHLLSSADGCSLSTVTRRINSTMKRVRSPLAGTRYSKFMHAVDRHDQLRQLFSLSSRHGFKKFYIKIMLSIMDMVLVNSFIVYKMVHPDVCETGMARYDFMDSIAEALMSNDWGNFSSSVSGNTNDKLFEELVEQRTEPLLEAESPTDASELVLGKNVSCADCVHNAVTGLWEKRSKKRNLHARFVGLKAAERTS